MFKEISRIAEGTTPLRAGGMTRRWSVLGAYDGELVGWTWWSPKVDEDGVPILRSSCDWEGPTARAVNPPQPSLFALAPGYRWPIHKIVRGLRSAAWGLVWGRGYYTLSRYSFAGRIVLGWKAEIQTIATIYLHPPEATPQSLIVLAAHHLSERYHCGVRLDHRFHSPGGTQCQTRTTPHNP